MDLERPQESFVVWRKRQALETFLKDVSSIMEIGFAAINSEDAFSDKERRKIVRATIEKLESREEFYEKYKDRGCRWNGNNWRWYNKLIDEMKERGIE